VKPIVSKALEDSTYVDDFGESKAELEELLQLINDIDEVLGSVSVTVKDWTLSGRDPSDKVSTDGVSLDIGGMKWFSKLDLIEVKIPVLHFGKIVRGRIKSGTKFFEGGTMADLDKFLPSRLSKRQVASKAASIYDPLGKLTPVLALVKQLLRLTNAKTVGWDDPMPASIRSKWCEAFWRFEMLRGLKFSRPVMPVDAVDKKLRILAGADAAEQMEMECIRCKLKRKHFMEVTMGPVSQHQLSVAPPMWAAQCDLFGPCTVYVHGYERETRGRKALATEVHVMVFVCPSTRLVNLQVIEGKNSGCILEGVTRLACEVGVPKYLMVDDDAAIHKALRELQVDLRDLKYQLHSEKGIIFDVCPVSGHNMHGQVERTIRSIQESLNDCGIKKLRLHATSLQTLLKLVENTYNNAPLGYSHGRDADNGPILKTISPNMMRMGHNNERALDGNFRLPVGGYEMVEKVDRMYQAWYKLWRDSVVPKLIRKPKWFKTDKHLKPGDLVYYEKDSGKVTSPWVMGIVDQVLRGPDGLIREAVIVFRNHGETFNRLTNRAVRSLVRIFSIDDG
jgi:hypothetical protein